MTKTAFDPQAAAWPDQEGILSLARDLLPSYLMRQRWYPAKDAGMPFVELSAFVALPLPEFSAALAIWTARVPDRPALQLFVPVAVLREGELPESDPAFIGKDGVVLADAFGLDAFVRAFVRLMVGAGAGLAAELSTGRTAAARSFASDEEWRVRRGSAEQSNTSIRIGEGAILKVIRKLLSGVNPELEMGRFLSERAGFESIPALLGWVDWGGSTLAELQAFVPNEGDGWSWILERLRADAAQRDRSLRWVGSLGARTAEMHEALSIRSDDPAFEPQVADATDWRRWQADIEAMAERVCERLGAADLDGAARRIADEFTQRCRGLASVLEALLPASPVEKTRHHGDYHLGQVLVSGDDVTIVDFEGEPLRPLEERRAKHIPLRDVAGMLRSFGYAAAVAERELPQLPAASRAAARAALEQWTVDASRAFLERYLQTRAAKAPRPDEGPAGRRQALRVIRFFTLEKALYEVLYELANRPDWVTIPLASALSLLEKPAADEFEPAQQQSRSRVHRMPQGAELLSGGGVRFRLWAPGCDRVELALYDRNDAKTPADITSMAPQDEGWHELTVADAAAGTRYHFVLPDGTRVPDPASRFQPDDVHGPSEVIDPAAYGWENAGWGSRPWHEAVVYELHVGAFTAQGTFRAAIERLDHIAALGVTAIEIMPVADFPGSRNWGYDGVLLYAPDSSYGRPEDLKALVDAAHARGLMVLLDVVYNHFGPDGNYLPVYAPAFFTDRHKTPWGAAINYDGPHSRPVREFIVHNALYWLEEYNLDGLRLDAVHAIIDDGDKHVLDELAERVHALGRGAHLILENEENQARWLMRDAGGAPLRYTAQWNDDLHHVLHVAATGEATGYYAEYLEDTRKLARSLAEGFAFQGETMAFRNSPRGEPSASLPPAAFISFIQNHDQIGNRAFGERLTTIAPEPAIRAVAAVYLLLPQVPMLFMGEEWGAAQPFPFFCDFAGELADAVRNGRRQEFAKFPEFQDPALRERIPDPQADSTFRSAKLDWTSLDTPKHASWRKFYAELLSIRREALGPLLHRFGPHAGRYEVLDGGAVLVRWRADGDRELTLAANLSAKNAAAFPAAQGRLLWQEGRPNDGGRSDPWFVRWSLT